MAVSRKAEILWHEWRRLERPDGVPNKTSIDPARLTSILPDMLIYECLDGGDAWRFRLMGTRVVDRIGRDATGTNPLDLMHGNGRAIARDAFLRVIQEPTGHLSRVTDEYSDGKTSSIEILRLPLRAPNGSVTIIVSVTEELLKKHDRMPTAGPPPTLGAPYQ